LSRSKTKGVKKRLYKRLKESSPVPTWVVIKTKRKVRTSPKRRSWRRTRLKVK